MNREKADQPTMSEKGEIKALKATWEYTATRFDELQKLVIDGFKRVDEKFERIDKKLEQISTQNDRLDTRLTFMDGRVTHLDGRITHLESRMDDQFDTLKQKLEISPQ